MNNNELYSLDEALVYLNEGFIKNKWNKLNKKAAKKLIEEFIIKGDYQSAKNCLNENKKYFSKEEYDKLKEEIESITTKPKERDDSETLNDVEKRFLNTAFNFINSEYKKLLKNPQYKDEKEMLKYLYCNKAENKKIYKDILDIAYVGFDEEFKMEYDENIQLFDCADSLRSDLEDIIEKKYKGVIDYTSDFNEGRETAFFIERKNIPGNK